MERGGKSIKCHSYGKKNGTKGLGQIEIAVERSKCYAILSVGNVVGAFWFGAFVVL